MEKIIRLLMLVAVAGGAQGLLTGCNTQASSEGAIATGEQSLSACGIEALSVRETPERIEGNASKCFIAMEANKRARLTKDPNDLGLLEARLVSDAAGVRVYEGKGTSPGTSLFGAATDVAGYTCSVNGFPSAEQAQNAVEICSLLKGGAR